MKAERERPHDQMCTQLTAHIDLHLLQKKENCLVDLVRCSPVLFVA